MRIVEKDMVFYRRSGGGVTLSGGEPFMQPVFVRHLLDRCEHLGINTAVETCGFFDWSVAAAVIRRFQLVFFDIKHKDPAIHRRITGASNAVILENAQRVARLGIPLIVRIPVVPSLNDEVDNVRRTARFVRQHLGGAVGIELLPYHALGKAKYERLGRPYELEHVKPPTDERMNLLREVIEETGVRSLGGPKDVVQQYSKV